MDLLELKCVLLTRGIATGELNFEGVRRGGAGPAGKCIDLGGVLANIPIHHPQSPRSEVKLSEQNESLLECEGNLIPFEEIKEPTFYKHETSDGVPMKKIALLHGRDCLATTLYQRCIFIKKGFGCGFCSIETTLKNGNTILEKTPSQMEEATAEAIKEGVKHLTITTGTPNLNDHGAEKISQTVRRLKEKFNIKIHAQLTPPGKRYIDMVYYSGADTIGLHMETFDKGVMEEVCPAKKDLDYYTALEYSAELFGDSQVSSFILGGLGEEFSTTIRGFEKLSALGVIPFLVPFRPLPGSRMENVSAPEPHYMVALYTKLADILGEFGVDYRKNQAGCVRCGACSAIDMAVGRV